MPAKCSLGLQERFLAALEMTTIAMIFAPPIERQQLL
jgi:hypothetical protein